VRLGHRGDDLAVRRASEKRAVLVIFSFRRLNQLDRLWRFRIRDFIRHNLTYERLVARHLAAATQRQYNRFPVDDVAFDRQGPA
jgi:hypothetical protein